MIDYSPGSLVHARGREWIVLTGSTAETLRVRPVSGSEEDQTLLHVPLETEPVRDARFPHPEVTERASHDAAMLLRDALLLSLRRGAGPFRGFGQIAVEPRAYQLVPLLMALKQDPVRLLVGDDVGVGKTIEAALIVRELLDRGDVERSTVLCPPHLVEQWVHELDTRFHIHAVAVTAASAGRLEGQLPPQTSIFDAHKHTVVSLDYIKSDKRRADFLRACPELVVVDEAHTCASTGPGRHQRHDLLKGLAADASRHLVLLTATPHSGDDAAFYRLLGLLDRDFERLADAEGDAREDLRERLSRHFVQRRRPDIAAWDRAELFPKRETAELTYKLTGEWDAFFDAVIGYCADAVESGPRTTFWGMLALLRCAASSPVAAVLALRTRAGVEDAQGEREALLDRLFDGDADSLPDDDVEPPAASDDPALADLVARAERLAGKDGDPKLTLLTEHVRHLVDAGFSPVVFCRYIATAHYLQRHLKKKLGDTRVEVVTGELTSDERRLAVDAFDDGRRVLVATDCLSEGINLQHHFDAVVHYDLSWNPTRHEQREGRVDRFGQRKPVVRATLLYGANNPVDGAVLEVILRKAERIREELGVPVPLPDDGHTLSQALLRAVLLRRRDRTGQGEFVFANASRAIDVKWKDAAEKAKKNRTVFAQRRLKPEEVLPEWHRTLRAVGGQDDVKRFAGRALARLGSGLDPLRRGFKAPLAALPRDVAERLEGEGLEGTLRVDFEQPPASGCRLVTRSHPLVAVLAETLLERTLGSDDTTDPAVLGRVACWVSDGVAERTVVALLRLRHQLSTTRARGTSTLLVEEATAVAWRGAAGVPVAEGADALALLVPPPVGDPPEHVRDRQAAAAIRELADRAALLDAFAGRRADDLLADHRRVRAAADDRGRYAVRALLPPDVIGLFVLLPRVS